MAWQGRLKGGVVIGLFAALGALTARAIAANVIATGAWLWTLAVVAVIDGINGGPRLGFAQLGVWKFVDDGMQWRNIYLPTAILTLGAALLIGGFAAWPAYRVSNGQMWGMQLRLNDCYRQQRFPYPGFGSEATVAVAVFMGVNAKGSVSIAPSIKR